MFFSKPQKPGYYARQNESAPETALGMLIQAQENHKKSINWGTGSIPMNCELGDRHYHRRRLREIDDEYDRYAARIAAQEVASEALRRMDRMQAEIDPIDTAAGRMIIEIACGIYRLMELAKIHDGDPDAVIADLKKGATKKDDREN